MAPLYFKHCMVAWVGMSHRSTGAWRGLGQIHRLLGSLLKNTAGRRVERLTSDPRPPRLRGRSRFFVLRSAVVEFDADARVSARRWTTWGPVTKCLVHSLPESLDVLAYWQINNQRKWWIARAVGLCGLISPPECVQVKPAFIHHRVQHKCISQE